MIRPSKRSQFLCRLTGAITLAWSCSGIHAQTVSEGHLSYAIGAIRFLETPRSVMMFKGDQLLGYSSIQAGGWLSPAIQASEDGQIHWGAQTFDSATGNQVKPPAASRCLAKVAIGPTALTTVEGERLVVVSPVSDANDRTVAYASETRQYPGCTVTARQRIGQADIDHFFELGASKSGAWLIGSASDGTILLRKWTKEWTQIARPPDVNGILSANWSPDGKLWLLANELSGDQVKPALFTTEDMGKKWERLAFIKSNLPHYWLEALRQLSAEDSTK